jgi:hypothetical protein
VLATDDWPHLYLEKPSVPGLYVSVLLVLMLASTALVIGVEPAVRRPNVHFLLLGAGFMLLETRSITQMALLFGMTWQVNAIVFAAILLTILTANLLVQLNWAPGSRVSYALLLPILVAGWFLPTGTLLVLGFTPRVIAACLVIGLPILFASLVFSISFRDQTAIDRAFGSNLLGVVFGGALEYLSNVWGLNALYLVACALYLASAVALPSQRWRV